MELEMSTKTKGTDFERVHIEEGLYEAELSEVKDISEGQYGSRVAFIYTVKAENPVELAYVCYKTKATTDNKIGKALIAHGQSIADGKISTENLPNKSVKVLVEDFEMEQNGKKITASTISKVKPLAEPEKV